GVRAFALEGVEDLLNRVHKEKDKGFRGLGLRVEGKPRALFALHPSPVVLLDPRPSTLSRVSGRILRSSLRESAKAELTGVAVAAGGAGRIGVVAALRECVVHAQFQAESDDLRLGEIDQRRPDANRVRAFDAAARREIRHSLIGLDVLTPAVWIARIVQRIHT